MVSVARLNFGVYYGKFTVKDISLIDDGKYWKVDMTTSGLDPNQQVIIDTKTLMSRKNNEFGEWRSLEELKAIYIAEIQANYPLGKPQKTIIDDKEIWKVPIDAYSHESGKSIVEYVYVDLKTGKSKNTLKEFNKASETDDWLTLKEVDEVINKGNYQLNYLKTLNQTPFRDALRDLYLE